MRKLSKEETRDMWVSYKTNPTKALQRRIVEQYRPLVHKTASTFVAKRPNVLDYDDLVQAGLEGLLDAIEKFNPDNERGAQFQTYATWRVRGAILDQINAMDWTPRSVRQNIKSVIATIETHYKREGVDPTVEELADETDLPTDSVIEILGQMQKTFISHMEESIIELGSPVATENDAELVQAVSFAMRHSLSEQERAYVLLRFHYGYTNQEIRDTISVTSNELRVIRVDAFRKLRSLLEGFVVTNDDPAEPRQD